MSKILDSLGAVLSVAERVSTLRDAAKGESHGVTSLQLRVEALEVDNADLRATVEALAKMVAGQSTTASVATIRKAAKKAKRKAK